MIELKINKRLKTRKTLEEHFSERFRNYSIVTKRIYHYIYVSPYEAEEKAMEVLKEELWIKPNMLTLKVFGFDIKIKPNWDQILRDYVILVTDNGTLFFAHPDNIEAIKEKLNDRIKVLKAPSYRDLLIKKMSALPPHVICPPYYQYVTCPECNSRRLQRKGGIIECLDCGWLKKINKLTEDEFLYMVMEQSREDPESILADDDFMAKFFDGQV